jgi:hypothetical protein
LTSYHGFSICDTYFAVVKQKLRINYLCKIIQNPEETWELFSQHSYTTVTILSTISNRETPPGLFNFYQSGITPFSCFYFVPGQGPFCIKGSDSEE